MIALKTLKAIEYDKILAKVCEYAVLKKTKESLSSFTPVSDEASAKELVAKTEEAYKLLYVKDAGGIYFFDDVESELTRADAGGTLNNAELLRIAQCLKGARLLKTSIIGVKDDSIKKLTEIAARLYVNPDFEKEITDKIISQDEISDNASPKLYSIRKSIRDINAKIREKLNSFMRGGLSKYLQDGVVTMRQDRYVIPVKSEYRSFVKGFIHDQSSSGSTVFIEPEEVMELNNDLKKAAFDEAEEIHRILADLSYRVTFMSDALRYNTENVSEIDSFYARAQYSFINKCTKPDINSKGITVIKKGRHPLIPSEKVVPVSLSIGKEYRFLLVTGPNTGGKTVTLKLTGLLSLMAASGLYVPAEDGSCFSVYDDVYCDIGDEQSIEQNLSTFSSHLKNIVEIIDGAKGKSLILLDEIGAGTDPEEGSALALAVIKRLLSRDAFGIITTHYSRLKVFAMEEEGIENASMEFDTKTLRPLYRLNVGIPGSSNAIEIASMLGLNKSVINDALNLLSDKQIGFESVLKKAEESRREAENAKAECEKIKQEEADALKIINEEKEKITAEREKIYQNARQETKRIVADKLSEAEEIIDELKDILKRAGLESKEVFKAGELRNRLKNSRYLAADDDGPFELKPVEKTAVKVGNKVYVKSLGCYGKISAVKNNGKEAEISVGNIKSIVKVSDIFNSETAAIEEPVAVKVKRNTTGVPETKEINVVGKNTLEAIDDVKNFIDKAVMYNFEEIKIIHGVGKGILLKAVREYLKTDRNVESFRRGKLGEGENGVTIVTLK